MTSFEEKVKSAAETAVLKAISSGQWLGVDWSQRVLLPPGWWEECWALVNKEGIKEQVAKRIEQELADRILNALAAEMATDIKQLLSNKERREALRALARKHLDEITKKGE